MTASDSEKSGSISTRTAMLCWALVAAVSAGGFAAYAAMLPFAAEQTAQLGALTLLAILSVFIGSVSDLFCPVMNIGFGVVILTLILGGVTHYSPTPFLVGITMFTSILSSAMWVMSLMITIANLKQR